MTPIYRIEIKLIRRIDTGRAVSDEEIETDGAGAFETLVPFERMKAIYDLLCAELKSEWQKI